MEKEKEWWATGFEEANRITERQKTCLTRYFHYIIPLLTEAEKLSLELMGKEAWVDAVGFQRAFTLIEILKNSKPKPKEAKETKVSKILSKLYEDRMLPDDV